MEIGQIGLGAGWRQQSVLAHASATQSPLDARSAELANQMPLMNRSPYEPNKAGFGSGTVSVPTEAVYAIGRNMKYAKNIVPSSEEARAKVRERISELRQERLDAMSAGAENAPQPRAVAGRNALALMNDINAATKQAKEPVLGTNSGSEGISPFAQGGNDSALLGRTSGPLLDVFV